MLLSLAHKSSSDDSNDEDSHTPIKTRAKRARKTRKLARDDQDHATVEASSEHQSPSLNLSVPPPSAAVNKTPEDRSLVEMANDPWRLNFSTTLTTRKDSWRKMWHSKNKQRSTEKDPSSLPVMDPSAALPVTVAIPQLPVESLSAVPVVMPGMNPSPINDDANRTKKRPWGTVAKSPSFGGQSTHRAENVGHWSSEEHELFLEGLKRFGRRWARISEIIQTRTADQVRSHAQKYFKKAKKVHDDGPTPNSTPSDPVASSISSILQMTASPQVTPSPLQSSEPGIMPPAVPPAIALPPKEPPQQREYRA